MNQDQNDFTRGGIAGQMVRFGLPLLLANLLQSLYSMADMLVVGRIVGKTGLAAISNASAISFLITSICIGVATGGTVLIARCKGAGDETGQREAVGGLFALSLLLSLLITAAGLASYRAVFRLMRVPESAMADACGYMRIVCLGTACVFGYNAVCSVLKGLGDSKNPLLFVAVAAAVNVGLDLLLVGPLGMGTAGAAWATVAAQGISFAFAVRRLRRMGFPLGLRFSRPAFRAILGVGLPAAGQMAVVNLSYLLMSGMFNGCGVEAAAAAGIGLKINTFAGMPCWAAGQAVTAIVSQNVGARRTDRVRQAGLTGLLVSVLSSLAAAVLVQLFAAPLISLFDPSSPAVLKLGVLYLRITCSLNALVYAAMYAFDSFAVGTGAPSLAMANALLDSFAVRLSAGWILGELLGLGFAGICLGQALSPLLPTAIGLCYFCKGRWRRQPPDSEPPQR